MLAVAAMVGLFVAKVGRVPHTVGLLLTGLTPSLLEVDRKLDRGRGGERTVHATEEADE